MGAHFHTPQAAGTGLIILLKRRAPAFRSRARNRTTLAWLRALFEPFPAHQIKHLTKQFPLIHESPLTDALFLLVSKSDEVTTT